MIYIKTASIFFSTHLVVTHIAQAKVATTNTRTHLILSQTSAFPLSLSFWLCLTTENYYSNHAIYSAAASFLAQIENLRPQCIKKLDGIPMTYISTAIITSMLRTLAIQFPPCYIRASCSCCRSCFCSHTPLAHTNGTIIIVIVQRRRMNYDK